jgi:hypothetical protein
LTALALSNSSSFVRLKLGGAVALMSCTHDLFSMPKLALPWDVVITPSNTHVQIFAFDKFSAEGMSIFA